MPSKFAGLRSLFKGRDPELPADLDPGFEVNVSEADEGEDVDKSSPYINVDLAGQVFGIEYAGPQGALSRRWVSIEGFKQSGAGDWSICAYCFIRKRMWSISLDRVQAVFDTGGEPVALADIVPASSGIAPVSDAMADTSGRAKA